MSKKSVLMNTMPAGSPAYYLGFDTAKATLDWSLIDQQGIEQSYGKVTNAANEIATLLLTIAGNYPGGRSTVHRLQCHLDPATN